jgi:hypothetical protein
MATEHVKIAKIKKPCENKNSPLSETNIDHPLPHGENAQIEIYSDMRRTRTGIQNCEHVYSDRSFGMERHVNAKPKDTGKKN